MKNVLSRIISIASFTFFFMFFLGDLVARKIPLSEYPNELWCIIIIFIVLILGFIISILDKNIGAKIMTTGGVVAGLYLLILGGSKNLNAALIFSVPFIVSGLLLFSKKNESI